MMCCVLDGIICDVKRMISATAAIRAASSCWPWPKRTCKEERVAAVIQGCLP